MGLGHILGSLGPLLYREVCPHDKDRLRGWRNSFVLGVDTTRPVSLLTTVAPYASSHERAQRTQTVALLGQTPEKFRVPVTLRLARLI